MSASCSNCWNYKDGECHRHAPIAIDASWNHPDGSRIFETKTVWPVVQPTDVCGDWEGDLTCK